MTTDKNRDQPAWLEIGEIIGWLVLNWRAETINELSSDPYWIVEELEFKRESHRQNSAESIADLEEIDDLLEVASRIRATLIDTIARANQGKNHEILVAKNLQSSLDDPEAEDWRFTTASVNEWARRNFGLEIPEWAPAQRESPAYQQETSEQHQTKHLSDIERDKLFVQIAILSELVADERSHRLTDSGSTKRNDLLSHSGVNAMNLADLMVEKAKRNRVSMVGLSQETLRKRLSESAKTMTRYQSKK